jgi:hypothetical protein
VVCTDIISHIADEMRHELLSKILSNKSRISVFIDESTSLGRLSCLVVFVRATFDVIYGPITFFLNIVELSCTNADSIREELMKCIISHGLTEEFLKEFWIGLGADGHL